MTSTLYCIKEPSGKTVAYLQLYTDRNDGNSAMDPALPTAGGFDLNDL